VTQVYPRGGDDPLGSFLHRLARQLPERGVEVRVVAPGAPDVPGDESRDGVRIHRFAYPGMDRRPFAYTGEMHRAAARAPLGFLRFAAAMRRAARAAMGEWPDAIVHAHWWAPPALLVAGPAGRRGMPLVISLHGTDVRLLRRLPGARALARPVLRRAALVLPVSAWLAREIAPLAGDTACEVFPMPADDSVFTFPDPGTAAERRGLVAVARLTAQKRVDVLVRAVARLAARGVKTEVLVAGDGPERASLERLAAAEGVADRFRFAGMVAPGELARRLGEAVALVMPSEREGYGLAIVEAALTGAPAVAVRSGALPDLVDPGRTGWLVEPGSPDRLADALAEVLSDPAEASRRGRAARERARELTPGPAADRLVGLYRRFTRP
jgi:glycosyltransferase involved in cell wall biosynthesis